jgi:hypothetical protein
VKTFRFGDQFNHPGALLRQQAFEPARFIRDESRSARRRSTPEPQRCLKRLLSQSNAPLDLDTWDGHLQLREARSNLQIFEGPAQIPVREHKGVLALAQPVALPSALSRGFPSKGLPLKPLDIGLHAEGKRPRMARRSGRGIDCQSDRERFGKHQGIEDLRLQVRADLDIRPAYRNQVKAPLPSFRTPLLARARPAWYEIAEAVGRGSLGGKAVKSPCVEASSTVMLTETAEALLGMLQAPTICTVRVCPALIGAG